jgi:hypothetical protein
MRARLLQAAMSGLIRVEGALEVLEELAGAHNVRRASDFLLDLVDRRWMFPLRERYLREVACGGRLPEDQLYLPRDMRRNLKSFRDRRDVLRSIASEVREDREKYKVDSEQARAEVVTHMGNTSTPEGGAPPDAIRDAMWAWWKEGHVAEWCRDMLDAGVKRKWIVASGDHWPDP